MTLGIIGAGAMGGGIAQVAAMAGWEVFLYDMNPQAILKAQDFHAYIFNRMADKGKITDAQAKEIVSRIYYHDQLNIIKDCNLVIEAIVEKENIKKQVYREIEALVSDDCIIATNTSSLSVTSLAAALEKPDRFLGIHFFNPAALMQLVEIIPAHQTARKVVDQAQSIVDNWDKWTVLAKDTPGFIVNKVARPFYSEALRIVEEGIATPSEVDEAMVRLGGFQMGPFTLMDFIGHDVNYLVTESVWKAFYYDERYRPSLIQKKLVESGMLGRKAGRGFYHWEEGKKVESAVHLSAQKAETIFQRIIAMLINEAADTVYQQICTEAGVETAMTKGVNYPKGLLAWGKEIGYHEIVKTLDELFAYYHESRYRVSPGLRKRTVEK